MVPRSLECPLHSAPYLSRYLWQMFAFALKFMNNSDPTTRNRRCHLTYNFNNIERLSDKDLGCYQHVERQNESKRKYLGYPASSPCRQIFYCLRHGSLMVTTLKLYSFLPSRHFFEAVTRKRKGRQTCTNIVDKITLMKICQWLC
jgi:hypothetical protein